MLKLTTGAVRTFTSSRVCRTMAATTKLGSTAIKFGPFEVTGQAFLKTPHSFALVNLKPLLPGHILVCPLRPHPRLTDLTAEETADLFSAVQLTQRVLGKLYFPDADPLRGSFTVAVQDGPEAGQTVPHVHVHVIPRVKGDMARSDDVYVGLAGEEGNVGGALWDKMQRPVPGGGFPRIEDMDRDARTMQEMIEEAEKYRSALRDMGVD
jgi:bis(5'-adenosyl)-triphosphatase